jgi:hypothetical protein
MLWEIWGRHKLNFLWQAVALAASVFLVLWKEHGASKDLGDVLGFVSFCCFLGAYSHLLVCFGYIEMDAQKTQIGFPGRLLLKPVSTVRLALAPMLIGGAITVTVFAAWAELVLRHLVGISASDLLWTSTVLVSFLWWMQALAWGFPLPKVRMLAVVMVAVAHFFVWHIPQKPASEWPGWRWPILAALLVTAAPAAWMGLKLMRQGRWEGPSRFSMLWSRLRLGRVPGRRGRFGSAFGAQFWLEWRRQGWLLPRIAGGMALLIGGVFGIAFFLLRRISGEAAQGGDSEWVMILSMFVLSLLVVPLVLSVVMSPVLAKFDRLHASAELPVYIAVRPMPNGGIVMAKLAMALATSALTWLITVAACLWLALMGKGILISRAGWVTPYGTVAFMSGCVPVLLVLFIWTWKNLVAGIGACLTGRAWIGVASSIWRLFLLEGVGLLAWSAWTNVNFREALLPWLPGILIASLAAKIAVSATAFVLGLRRNAITARAVGWIVGGWLVCGLFVAGYAGHVCKAIHKPDVWIWIALAGFLVLPLADLAIAPLALAWNRHR